MNDTDRIDLAYAPRFALGRLSVHPGTRELIRDDGESEILERRRTRGMTMRSLFAWIALLALAIPAAAPAQTAPVTPVVAAEPLKARLAELPGIVAGTGDFDAFFAPGFRAQVSKARLAELLAPVIANYGPPGAIEASTPTSPWSADFTLGLRDATISGRIAVDPAEPHQVTGLLFTGVSPRGGGTMEETLSAIRALHGTSGFVIARLGEGAPQFLTGHNENRAFAIGSAFKLVILAELVRATNAGERKWTDQVTLEGRGDLPGGAFFAATAGTQVTLKVLATMMISASDNSATDILIRTLGRERIEAMLPVVGIAAPGGMRPMLTTLEMFKLKGVRGGELGREWIAANEAGRRAMLPRIDAEPLLAVDPRLFADGKPLMIDTIEWFATPADLVRVMDWLRRNTESGAGAEARGILAVNPGMAAPDAQRWAYVGYKGGSEPGVLNMTYLMRGKDGSWYAISGSWNDPAAAVDTIPFAALMGRAATLTAP